MASLHECTIFYGGLNPELRVKDTMLSANNIVYGYCPMTTATRRTKNRNSSSRQRLQKLLDRPAESGDIYD
jgi:hypothetical protein